MENEMISVLLVDDEKIVREGLRVLLDWSSLGCCICGEASNGKEALLQIERYHPSLVLLDIRMPGMPGTELMEKARAAGYEGDFIILSGYSDFKYAQTALHFGASFYITKPVDEEELEKAVLSVREKIAEKNKQETSRSQYLQKARTTVLLDLLTGRDFNPAINYPEMGLASPIYQVIIYEGYTPYFHAYDFSDILMITNQDNHSFESLTIENQNVILLKGNFALSRFQDCLKHYESGTQKGSPLYSIFLTYGPAVFSLQDISRSYQVCHSLMQRRFFCSEDQHVLSYEALPAPLLLHPSASPSLSRSFSDELVSYIKTCNKRRICEVLDRLQKELYYSSDDITAIKYFLADIFLQVKQDIMHTYGDLELPFAHNAAILELIENKHYLYEIIQYFSEQFDMIIRGIGHDGSDHVFDDILDYLERNYAESLKLEVLAPLFGYNSSYLGKLFSQKAGMGFNAYLDQVRLKKAMELLENTDMKVYEIATRTGYKNVDYFHQKFRKYKDMSPAEYRQSKRQPS